MNCQDDILYPALRLARVTGGPGRTASPDQTADALAALNRLIDSWNIVQGLIYSKRRSEYMLSPPKPTYTIGRGPGADFVADRPTRIDALNAILYSGADKTYTPIAMLSADEWARIQVRTFPIDWPGQCYVDYASPNTVLYFYGTPNGSPGLEVWDWLQGDQFASEADEVIVPPGYLEALVLNLAVKLADQFGTQISPNIYSDARKALGRVMALNNPSRAIRSDDFGTRSGPGSDFNWATGGPA